MTEAGEGPLEEARRAHIKAGFALEEACRAWESVDRMRFDAYRVWIEAGLRVRALEAKP